MPVTEFELRQIIHDAFIDAPFPTDGYDIYAAQETDDNGASDFTTIQLPGRKWYEVTAEQLLDCYAAFSFLRPDGWRHYLPAALLLELTDPYNNVNILWHLKRPGGDFEQHLESRHISLGQEQTAAVIAFVEYYIARERNIHAARAHAFYAKSGITWKEELDPWPCLGKKMELLGYWRERWSSLTV